MVGKLNFILCFVKQQCRVDLRQNKDVNICFLIWSVRRKVWRCQRSCISMAKRKRTKRRRMVEKQYTEK